MQRPQFAVCAALLLACLPWGAAAAEGVGLFSADAGTTPLRPPARRLFAEDAGSDGGPHGNGFPELSAPRELRSRSARIDIGRLSAARSEVAQGRPHHLRLNLFADAGFDALIERTAPTASGYTLTGRLADEPLSMVVVAVNGGHVAGTVWSSRGVHSIRARGGIAEIRQLNPMASGRCEVVEAPPTAHPDASRKPRSGDSPFAPQPRARADTAVAPKAASQNANSAQSDEGDVIDLLVVYPPFARRSQGGHQAMRMLIEQDVAVTNEMLRSSGVEFRIALVAAVEVDYEESDASIITIAFDLLDGSDGQLDDVHALRDSYAADLVTLHLGDGPPRDFGVGAAELLTAENYSNGDRPAFNVVSSVIPSPMAHEIGHNMGLYHDRNSVFSKPEVQDPRPVYPYGYGYVAADPSAFAETGGDTWRTIMHFNSQNIPRFSNPNQRWPDESGVPIGAPGDEWINGVEGPADAVRALNNIRRYVANHRASASRCTYALSPAPPRLPAQGGEYRIQVGTAPGCAWTARADGDGFATLTAGRSGVGSGEAAFQVAANAGWEREVAVLVAGEVYAMRQAGARAVTPVCERPSPISEAISEAVGKPCAEVAQSDLAAVRNLQFAYRGVSTALGSGMLSGLSGLQWLKIWTEVSMHVQPGAFEGLVNLKEMYIHSRLTALPNGMFDGLSNLQVLSLHDNRLTVLKKDAFRELTNLRFLSVNANQLRALETGAFNGLSKLTELRLTNNNLTSLTPGVFDQLPRLRALRLSWNALTELKPGLFGQLPRLFYLDLDENALTELKPGLFDWKRLPWLGFLNLENNRLTRMAPGTFDGAILVSLDLQGNSLKLAPGAFDGLQVRFLSLQGNAMTKLPGGVFDGLSGLKTLRLHDNRLTALPAGLLHGLEDGLEYLLLGANRLRALPLGLFDGLAKLHQLDLSGNPGAPFPLSMELVPATSSDGGHDALAGILVEVAEGAPFDLIARLSASGAELSPQEIRVPKGRTQSEAVSVFPTGGGPVRIDLNPVPAVQHPSCGKDFLWSTYSPSCHLGVRAVAGAPLVMHGFLNQALAAEGAVRFDLPTAFPTFGSGTSYAVELSGPSAVQAVVRGGLLIIAADDGGETAVAVTATAPDGRREVRSFTVTVEQAVNSYWGGWRSVLLQRPHSEEGGDS